MSHKSYKKVVYVIVEGPSDETALGVILHQLFDKDKVYVEIMHGDITSDSKVNPSNITATLGNIIRKYANTNSFKQEDFREVIHLVDTDGAFIDDNYIVEDITADKPMYSLTSIHTNKLDKLKTRNEQKSKNLTIISSLNKIWKSIPYRAYYMSCNLDHVLYDKQNSSDDEKENDAFAFVKKYKNDINGFLTFMLDSDFSRINDFKSSWDFIMEGTHSLERWSNLGICFQSIKTERDNSIKYR